MKRILSILLSVVLVLGMIPATFAAGEEFKGAADNLYQLGLVSGTGTDANGDPIYELDRAPTRSEAITVLVKLLGKADEAGKGGWNTPFTDVPGWAQNFVGYAYANGLTAGTSATTFGGDDLVTAAQYITFVLKALGYSANGDFQWDKAWVLSDQLGITGGRYNANTTTFLRGDVFAISEAALKVKVKGSDQTLAEKLMGTGAFTRAQYDRVYGGEKKVLTAEEVYALCSPAVFYVEVYDSANRAIATGSGFFIDSTGKAVTNYHVIEGAQSASITTSDTKKTYKVTGVYDYSVQEDWAVIQVDGSGFSCLEIGDTSTVVGGATVYAIGSPLGLQNSISQGLISNVSRIENGVSYIQTSAAISSGSSGGALINKYGEVVGITSASYLEGQNLNLALPITIIEGYSTAGLQPVSAATPKPSVSYELDKNSVSLKVGESALVSMDAVETNVGGTITYSIKSGDKSVATVAWDDMDDRQLPWDIRITGIKAGSTTLTIYNDKTEDTISIPIVVAAPAASISYRLSAQSVAVGEGNSALISMDTVETNINDGVTYYIESEDDSVATVDWDDMDDEYLPWDIRITGVKAGSTTLIISNDQTDDTISVPIVVTATTRRQAAYTALKNFVLNHYNETFSETKEKMFEYETEDFTYQLIYDKQIDAVAVREIFWADSGEYVSYIMLDAQGTTYATAIYMYEPDEYEWSYHGLRTIDAKTFHEESTTPFDEYEGAVPGQESVIRSISNLLIVDSLEFVDIVLQELCQSEYTVKDFGFTRLG